MAGATDVICSCHPMGSHSLQSSFRIFKPCLRGILGFVALAPASLGQQPTADLILVNGKVFTATPAHPYTEAIAIRAGRILAVGKSGNISALASPHTIRIDLHGRVVIPGINDAHYHFLPHPDAHQLVLKEQDPTWKQVEDAIRSAVADTPKGTFINGEIGIAVLERPEVNRAALDKLAPEHPLRLACFWGHCSIFNSAFMRMMHISDQQTDPRGGYFTRDRSGQLTGRAIEYANFQLHAALQERTPEGVQLADAGELFREAARFGVTSMQVMAIGTRDKTAALMRKARAPIRVRVINFALDGTGHTIGEPQIRSQANVTVTGLKWILDGDPLARTAALRRPYADRPDTSGQEDFSESEMESMLRESLRRGEPLMVHVVGDRTAEDFFKAMAATGGPVIWNGKRVRIEHGEGLLPDLIPTAKALGVIVVQNPTDFTLGPVFTKRYGANAAKYRQPFRSLLQAGIPVAIGSDGATTTASAEEKTFRPDTEMNPYLNIMLASNDPFRSGESITREQAVIAYTLTAAYAEFAEKEKGSLEPGKLADLVVLSQDIFQVAAEDLPKTESVLTIVGGKIIYSAKR